MLVIVLDARSLSELKSWGQKKTCAVVEQETRKTEEIENELG
jgi:hypothetical protein